VSEVREALDRRGVAAYYDRLAPVYGAGALFAARRAAVVALMAGDLAAAHRVLDLGCGNGVFGSEFLARSPQALVVGADLSSEMLAAAQRRLGGRAPVLRADAGALPFRAGSFDLVFMSHVLLLVPDIERCVTEVSNLLAAGGKLVATVGAGAWRSTLGAILDPEEVQQLEALFGVCHMRVSDDEGRADAACRAVGLRAEVKHAPFSVDWNGVEEWIRIRWLTMLDEPLRTQAESWVAALRSRAAGHALQFAETVLIATRC
jgi:SAM-dependent methyltransferase